MTIAIKRTLAVILVMCLSIVPLYPVSAIAITSDEISPYYNNVKSANTVISIDNSGKLTITYKYTGSSSITTKAVITTYIEQKVLGLFWSRINIGTTNNEWVDTIKKSSYSGSRTFQLASKGTYRVTAVLAVALMKSKQKQQIHIRMINAVYNCTAFIIL